MICCLADEEEDDETGEIQLLTYVRKSSLPSIASEEEAAPPSVEQDTESPVIDQTPLPDTTLKETVAPSTSSPIEAQEDVPVAAADPADMPSDPTPEEPSPTEQEDEDTGGIVLLSYAPNNTDEVNSEHASCTEDNKETTIEADTMSVDKPAETEDSVPAKIEDSQSAETEDSEPAKTDDSSDVTHDKLLKLDENDNEAIPIVVSQEKEVSGLADVEESFGKAEHSVSDDNADITEVPTKTTKNVSNVNVSSSLQTS